MRVIAARLHPGQDLKLELERLAAGRGIGAGYVLTCVGSLARALLRPAGRAEPVVFEGPLEIVCLAGTLAPQGVHLHLVVSDEDCATHGGHLLAGCVVRTTAELVLGAEDAMTFARKADAATGYDELVVHQRRPPADD